MYVVTEVLLFAAISIKFGRPFNFTAFEAQRREVNAGDDPFGMADVPARLRIRKEIVHPYLGYVTAPVETIPVDALPEGEAALEAFDVLFEAPIPQNPNPARDLALRLGLVEAATFASGNQRATLWVRP